MKSLSGRIVFLALSLWSSEAAGQSYFTKEMLEDPTHHIAEWEAAWDASDVPVYKKDPSVRSVLIANGYAVSSLQQVRGWPPRLNAYRVLEVNMIITRYPKNKKTWHTNYYQLMADRMKALFAFDSRLNDSSVTYNLIFQTECNSEKDAQQLFHGFEIVYEEMKPDLTKKMISVFDTLKATPLNEDSLYWVRSGSKVQRQIKRGGGVGDSAVVKAFNTVSLDSALITIDCTGSMDPYANQVLLWLVKNFNDQPRYFSLFTDASATYKHGIYGQKNIMLGVFEKIDGLMRMFREARSIRGANREPEENDIEGILEGLLRFPFLTSVVLLADNNNCVKDISLLHCVTVPVNVIPCGSEHGLNPQYIDIAAFTGGRVFIGGKWLSFREKMDGHPFQVGGNVYHFDKKKKHFVHGKNDVYKHPSCARFYTKPPPCPQFGE